MHQTFVSNAGELGYFSEYQMLLGCDHPATLGVGIGKFWGAETCSLP